jgi:thymidylate synthase
VEGLRDLTGSDDDIDTRLSVILKERQLAVVSHNALEEMEHWPCHLLMLLREFFLSLDVVYRSSDHACSLPRKI